MARHYDLPLHDDGSGRFLPWFIGLMVYLASLALAASIALTSMIGHWDAGLRGSLTIQVPVPDDGSPLAQTKLDQVLQIVRQTPGVTAASALDPAVEAELLKPWLDEAPDDMPLPLPILLDIHVDPNTAPDTALLEQQLDAIVPGTLVATHERWLGRLLRAAGLVAMAGDVSVGLIGAGAILIVIFSTRTGLLIHQKVIELLHLVGARDSYIARQFQQHALRLALRGGAGGLGLALLTLGAVVITGTMGGDAAGQDLPTPFSFPIWGWFAMIGLPLLAGLIAMITARVTVLRILSRMP